MNFPLAISINVIFYSLYCYLSYRPDFKDKAWFTPTCLIIALIVHMAWLTLIKTISDGRTILLYSLIWDVLIVVVFLIIPIIFFKVNLNLTTGIGVGLIFIGLLLAKYGMSGIN